ncbi:amidohydrolase [Rhodococcus sp. 15-649-1-2]|nr:MULTISPECIES: amidohydrolase family protein [unclassified Rhodococcus (in: high G+C Gram-positive bacteria)]OZC76334.1 amidohydrolase [Rhodococcus sp. 06-418-1B]OZE80186.1 amidohydrolase [Rhodococcus sp. 15-649-1-2]
MLVMNAVDLDGTPMSLRVQSGSIVERAQSLTGRPGEVVVDADRCTVIPGLHDHHIHLRSSAAALDSIALGPPAVSTRQAAAIALRTARTRADGWIRAVGYHESVGGELNRDLLDAWRADAPVRVQHSSGALWILNSAGLKLLGEAGHSDGRLFRRDRDIGWNGDDAGTSLTAVGKRLSSLGVTGCTDATPDMNSSSIAFFDEEIHTGRFKQILHLLALRNGAEHRVTFGPVKRILDDTDLVFDDLVAWILDVHGQDQSIAVHCVSVPQLVLTMTALRSTGTRPGDRIEHAAMVPDDVLSELAALGVTVVTSPNFVSERGDRYLLEVPRSEHDQLWRVASLMRSGVPTVAGTDAPFGDIDPWACMRAARSRTTRSGSILGVHERVHSRRALEMFLGTADFPNRPRELQPGRPADLCILSAPPATVLTELSADMVRTTIIRGEVVFER